MIPEVLILALHIASEGNSGTFLGLFHTALPAVVGPGAHAHLLAIGQVHFLLLSVQFLGNGGGRGGTAVGHAELANAGVGLGILGLAGYGKGNVHGVGIDAADGPARTSIGDAVELQVATIAAIHVQ